VCQSDMEIRPAGLPRPTAVGDKPQRPILPRITTNFEGALKLLGDTPVIPIQRRANLGPRRSVPHPAMVDEHSKDILRFRGIIERHPDLFEPFVARFDNELCRIRDTVSFLQGVGFKTENWGPELVEEREYIIQLVKEIEFAIAGFFVDAESFVESRAVYL